MLNQKGIVIAPILIWTFIIVSGLFATIVFKLQDDTTPNTVLVQPTPKPTSTSTETPTQTYIPTVKPVPVQTSSSKLTQTTNNGNRTGNIIKYKEYCKNGQEISIYEGELITKKTPDGNTYSMTKDDWVCYENKQTQQKTNTTSQTIKCTLPGYGVVDMTPSKCEEARNLGAATEALKGLVQSLRDEQTARNAYYNARLQKDSQDFQNNMNQISQTALPPVNNSYVNSPSSVQSCLDKFSALGTLDSSEAQKCYTNPDYYNNLPTPICYNSFDEYLKTLKPYEAPNYYQIGGSYCPR